MLRYLRSASGLLVQMVLVDQEMVRQYVVCDTREIHLEEAGRLIPAIPNETFFTPR